MRSRVMLNSSSSASRSASRAVPVGLDHFQHRADIVLDVEAAKDRRLLRQVADAKTRALIHGEFGDVVAVELDMPAIGLDQPGDHVEHGGLAGAVGPEQSDGLAAPHVEARAAYHLAPAEAFLDAVGREIGVAHRLPCAVDAARPRLPIAATPAIAGALPGLVPEPSEKVDHACLKAAD